MAAGSGIVGLGHLLFRRLFLKKSGRKKFDDFDQRPTKRLILFNFEANCTKNLFLFKESDNLSCFHVRSFLAFSRARNKAGGTTLTRQKQS